MARPTLACVTSSSALGKTLIVVLGILQKAQADLLQVALTARSARVFTSAGKDGKQNTRKDHYDGDYEKQFYEGEDFRA